MFDDHLITQQILLTLLFLFPNKDRSTENSRSPNDEHVDCVPALVALSAVDLLWQIDSAKAAQGVRAFGRGRQVVEQHHDDDPQAPRLQQHDAQRDFFAKTQASKRKTRENHTHSIVAYLEAKRLGFLRAKDFSQWSRALKIITVTEDNEITNMNDLTAS